MPRSYATTGSSVISVSNSDGTLTISPTTGAVIASLNLLHANTWNALQTFTSGINIGDQEGIIWGSGDVSIQNNGANLELTSNDGNIVLTGDGIMLTAFSNGVLRVASQLLTTSTTTTNLPEGTNLYFTDERAQDAVGAMVDSTIVYVDATPLLTRAALTGDITAPQSSNVTTLATVNSNVGTFGTATQVGTFTVNGKGLITAASNTTISLTSSNISDFTEAAQDAVGAMVDATLTYNDATPSLGINLSNANTWATTQTFTSINLTSSSGQIVFDSTSPTTTTLQDSASASSKTLTLPNVTSTLAALGLSQTFSAAQTFGAGLSVSSTFNINFGADNNSDVGSTSRRIQNIFIAGNLSDGTVTTTVANIAQLSGGNNFTGNQTITNASPTLTFVDSTASADDWSIGSSTNDTFTIRNTTAARNDLQFTDTGAATFNQGVTAANFTDSALTSGRVVIASTSGLLADDADLTFSTDTLSSTKIAVKAGNSTGNIAKVGGSIYDHFVDSTVGGAEADIYTDTTPADILNTNGDKIIAEYGGNFVTVGTELCQLKVYFAGTAIWDSTGVAPTTGTTSWRVYVELIRVSSTVVRYTVSLNTTGASGFVYCVVGELTGLTLSGTNILKITGTSTGVGSGAGDIVGKMGYVLWKPAA